MARRGTERPTPKRLQEARRRGEVATSRTLSGAAALLGAATTLAFTGDHAFGRLVSMTRTTLERSAREPGAVTRSLKQASVVFGEVVTPVMLGALVAGTVAGVIQTGGLFSFEPVTPRFERLRWNDPVRRVAVSSFEVVRTLVTLAVVFAVGWMTVEGGWRGIAGLAGRSSPVALGAIGASLHALAVRTAIALLVLGLVDLAYQRFRFLEQRKMTRDEVERERRETEGDPNVRRERSRSHRGLTEELTLHQAANASAVIVTDGSSLAACLRYDESVDPAPKVVHVARGVSVGLLLDAAVRAATPVARDGPLATRLCELDSGRSIPEALYEPVAIVLDDARRAPRSPESKPLQPA